MDISLTSAIGGMQNIQFSLECREDAQCSLAGRMNRGEEKRGRQRERGVGGVERGGGVRRRKAELEESEGAEREWGKERKRERLRVREGQGRERERETMMGRAEGVREKERGESEIERARD